MATTSQSMQQKTSMFSLLSNNNTPGATTLNASNVAPKGGFNNRPCTNCTCSPGLLSRTGRRSTSYLRQMSYSRQNKNKTGSSSGPNSPTKRSTRNSIYSVDSCEDLKEINTSLRLEKLRNLMNAYNVSIYIVPSEDSHQSEYTSPCDQRRSFISGFSGSAGVAIITRDLISMNDKPSGLSILSTDGRYFNQATNELDFNWTLLKQGVPGVPTWQEWCVNEATQMSLDSGEEIRIGIDPSLISINEVLNFEKLIGDAKVKFVEVNENLIDKLWDFFEEKPIRQFKDLIQLDIKYTGSTTEEKLSKISEDLIKNYDSNTLIVNSLDEIAWVLNLRGSDIDYNPIFYSYLIIEGDKMTLYTDNHERFEKIKINNLTLKQYDDVWKDISLKSSKLSEGGKNILISSKSSWKIVKSIPKSNYTVISSNIIDKLKSIKTKEEILGSIESHKKDGLAICKYFAWLEDEVFTKGNLINEYDAAMKLESIRQELPNYISLSFETISSTGANAAIIHYAPKDNDQSAYINPKKIYLCDCGSQFLEGTTDTTRTLHFDKPEQEEITNYTLVLKGHLNLAMLRFPKGSTTGLMIDSIARQYLWNQGLDYAHGTGHGVGAFLNVHEGPMGIGIRKYYNDFVLNEGNLMSNEPGYYKDGEYGIRIENMFYISEDKAINDNAERGSNRKEFLKFNTVTMVPYCRKLIDVKMLDSKEIKWINEYNDLIWNEFSKKLVKGSIEYNWLKRECAHF